jgi:hypothetical protein
MTREYILEQIKTLNPIDSGVSFHIYGETYIIDGKIVELMWAADQSVDEPTIEVNGDRVD